MAGRSSDCDYGFCSVGYVISDARASRFYTAVVKAERISFGFRLLTDKV